MKHLVTGGSGFLGNLISRRLLERGESVKILDIWEDVSRPKEIEFIKCDIRNRDGVAKAMRGINLVHHTVALVPLTKSGSEFREVNVIGSQIAGGTITVSTPVTPSKPVFKDEAITKLSLRVGYIFQLPTISLFI